MLWRCTCSAPWPAKMETDRSSRRVCCRQGCGMERHGVAPSSDKPVLPDADVETRMHDYTKSISLRHVLGTRRIVGLTWSELRVLGGFKYRPWPFQFPLFSIFPRPLFVSISAHKDKEITDATSRVPSGNSPDQPGRTRGGRIEIGLSKLT